ncbi:MAG: glycosyltransferase family 39 protein, partial [Anaerolineaceae bacterium]|nr:glycosyltransferase family 39 protein [Anaerolineaceae bacterium]
LRFPLYPLFVAPTLYFLIRGLRKSKINDLIIAGIFLGIGLHGYSPIRFMPFVVLLAVGCYLIHNSSKGNRKATLQGLLILAFFSLILFLPLFRYWTEDPAMFGYRAMSRLSSVEKDIPGPVFLVFLKNVWDSLIMFFWNNGNIWVHSVTGRPALDVISAVFFFQGLIIVASRYIRDRNWVDIFLLLSIPLLMMPSILSLAFPEENPSLNRSGGAIIPVFLIAGIGFENLFSFLWKKTLSNSSRAFVIVLGIGLLSMSMIQNKDLVFNQYKNQFSAGAWNTSEMGKLIQAFSESTGDLDRAYVVPFPHWVDTRLVGINAGYPQKDYALWPEDFWSVETVNGAKMFIIKPEDQTSIAALLEMFPEGLLTLHESPYDGKDFYMLYVPR